MTEYTVVELMVAGLVGNVVALFVLWGGLFLEVGTLFNRQDHLRNNFLDEKYGELPSKVRG